MLGNVEHQRTQKAVDVWILASGPERQLLGPGVVARNRGSRFYGGGLQPLLHDALLHLNLGIGERAGSISAGYLPRERDV